jgi:hypothetical protein
VESRTQLEVVHPAKTTDEARERSRNARYLGEREVRLAADHIAMKLGREG